MEELQQFSSPSVKLTVGSDGNVYGAAWNGADTGTIFRIDAAGTFSTVHTFVNNTSRLVVGQDGALYGTVFSPGGGGTSDLFRIDNQGNFTTVFTFPTWVASDLVLGSDGAFYGGLGYTDCVFSTCQFGNLFKIDGAGNFTILTGRIADAVPGAVGSDGAIYGATPRVNELNVFGDLFRLDTAGNYTVLHKFSYADGDITSAFVLAGDGLLYGALGYGNSIFRFGPAGNFTVVHAFSYAEGTGTLPPTVGSDGALYGVNSAGGAGFGTIFRMDLTGTVTVLRTFGVEGGPTNSLLLAHDGSLYGTTLGNSVFRIDSAGNVNSSQLAPADEVGGTASPLVQGSDCALYGVSESNRAVLYRLYEPGTLCQRIAFAPLPNRTFGDAPFAVSATASSGLPVSLHGSGSCSVTGDQVSFTRGGVCTVTASQPGDSRYQPAGDVSQSFNVAYVFSGFFHPVESPPVFNRVTAGRAVPIRFGLGADAGRDVIAEASPVVRRVSCETSAPLGEFEPAVAVGGKAPLHRDGKDRYLYPWKTERRWAGTCQEFVLELVDGTFHRASFSFESPHRFEREHERH